MICVSFMLAILLVWPMVFGSGGSSSLNAAPVVSRPAIVSTARADGAKLIRTAVVQVTPPPAKAIESCFKRYERAYAGCTGEAGGTCRQKVADGWDLCEATGFWPE
jgi:hypothetical protein